MKIVQLKDKDDDLVYPLTETVRSVPHWFGYTLKDATKAYNNETFTITSPLGYEYTFAPYNHSTGFVISGDNVSNVLAIRVYQGYDYTAASPYCKDIGMRDCSSVDSRYVTNCIAGTFSTNGQSGTWVFPREYDTSAQRSISLIYELNYNKFDLVGYGKCRYGMQGQCDCGHTNLQITRNSRDRIGTLYLSYGSNISSYSYYYFHIDILEDAPSRQLFTRGSIQKLQNGWDGGYYKVNSGSAATITTDLDEKTITFANTGTSTDCYIIPSNHYLGISFLQKVKAGKKIRFGYTAENDTETGKSQLYLFTGTSETSLYDAPYSVDITGSDKGEKTVTLSEDKLVGWRIDNDTPGSTVTFKNIHFIIED